MNDVDRTEGMRGAKAPKTIDIHIGIRIRLGRALAGVSQERLANALGISFQQVQKYEHAISRISASRLHDISNILNVPITFFFEGLGGGTAPILGEGSDDQSMTSDPSVDSSSNNAPLQRETQELSKAYHRIPDPSVRQRLRELIRSLQMSDA